MEIRQTFVEVAKWPLTTAHNIGSFVLGLSNSDERTIKLYEQEPISRAITALHSAGRAINKVKPDQDLARFEVLRAANAVNTISKVNPEIAVELGHGVIETALELPNNEVNYKIAEQVTETSLKMLAPPKIPMQRKQSD